MRMSPHGAVPATLFFRQIIIGGQAIRRGECQTTARNRKIIHDRISKIAFPCNRHLTAVDRIGALVIEVIAFAGESAFPVEFPCHGAIISARLLPSSLEGIASAATATAGGKRERWPSSK